MVHCIHARVHSYDTPIKFEANWISLSGINELYKKGWYAVNLTWEHSEKVDFMTSLFQTFVKWIDWGNFKWEFFGISYM